MDPSGNPYSLNAVAQHGVGIIPNYNGGTRLKSAFRFIVINN